MEPETPDAGAPEQGKDKGKKGRLTPRRVDRKRYDQPRFPPKKARTASLAGRRIGKNG